VVLANAIPDFIQFSFLWSESRRKGETQARVVVLFLRTGERASEYFGQSGRVFASLLAISPSPQKILKITCMCVHSGRRCPTEIQTELAKFKADTIQVLATRKKKFLYFSFIEKKIETNPLIFLLKKCMLLNQHSDFGEGREISAPKPVSNHQMNFETTSEHSALVVSFPHPAK